MSSTVLITTANDPPNGMMFLTTTDSATRRITAKAAVFFWAIQGVEKIVIADATGTTLLDENEMSMLNQMNIEVEQLHYFQDDETVKQKGKGYAEGMLMQFAMQNSEILKKETGFFKCTGKIYCRNFAQILHTIRTNHFKNIFWTNIDESGATRGWADTRFFYTSIDFFNEYLLPTYLSSDDNVAAIESLCFHLLSTRLPSIKTVRPLLVGFCGGTGELYMDSSFGELDTNFPSWLST
ncbi:hypothetical protein PQR63_06590 [Herbaspirillum rhizosphaerae]|uniref:Uncharacterized protein n=1 Tax=Herbaspirillum rhizosphaerae TaxID=346179 RepID=A0ABW8Z4R5_9BURK